MDITIPRTLLSSSSKTDKGEKLGYATAILYLSPHTIGGRNVCPNASAGCASACLYSAGRGVMGNVQRARINRTRYFWQRREQFLEQLKAEIVLANIKARARGLKLAVRLNGTSDLPWESLIGGTMERYQRQGIVFYDYTKSLKRMRKYLQAGTGANYGYHLTFSASEANHDECNEVLKMGGNVATVFQGVKGLKRGTRVDYGGHMPNLFGLAELHTINGDNHDARFLDPKHNVAGLRLGTGFIVALGAKGKAKKDRTGFVQDYPMDERAWSQIQEGTDSDQWERAL